MYICMYDRKKSDARIKLTTQSRRFAIAPFRSKLMREEQEMYYQKAICLLP